MKTKFDEGHTYKRFFETVQPNSQETAQKFEKRTYVNPFHYFNIQNNRCILL